MKRSYLDMQNDEQSMPSNNQIINEMPESINVINNILDDVNNMNLIQTDANNEVKNVNKVEEAINDEWNEMKLCQKRGIIQDMVKIIMAPINKIKTAFTTQPQPPIRSFIPATNIACLFISKHGGYDVFKNYETKTLEIQTELCPVENLIRYQYTPLGACGWGDIYTDYEYFWDSYKKLEFMTNQSLTIEDKRKMSITQLNSLVPLLSEHYDIITDFYKRQMLKKEYGEPKICNNIHKSNKITMIHKNHLLLNKKYHIETNDNIENIKLTSGILIMYDLTFKLPDIFFEPGTEFQEIPTPIYELKILTDKINNNIYQLTFKHGTYNNNGTISYTGLTELTSCPYFMLFLKLYEMGPKSDTVAEFKYNSSFQNPVTMTEVHLNYGLSLDNKNNVYNEDILKKIKDNNIINKENIKKPKEERTKLYKIDNILDVKEKRMMVYNVNSIQLYNYLKNVNTVINLDFTCSAFDITNRTRKKESIYLTKRFRTAYTEKRITGGKKSRRKQHKQSKKKKSTTYKKYKKI